MEYDSYDSPLGTLWLTGEKGALTGLAFERKTGMPVEKGDFIRVKCWLDNYFRGNPGPVDFPMAPRGTPFQKLIWQLLLEIPFGGTLTYGQLAREAARCLEKEKMSAQAVGQAASCNPIAVIIPCHRVVGADGKLTGYAWGLERKQWLISHEQKQREELR